VGNALTAESDLEEGGDLAVLGNVLALTENEDLNERVCRHWAGVLDKPRLYKWMSSTQDSLAYKGKGGNFGEAVWDDLGPELLGTLTEANLDSQRVEVRTITDKKDLFPHEVVLLSHSNGAFYPGLPQKIANEAEVLVLKRGMEGIAKRIYPPGVLIAQGGGLEAVVRELLDTLKSDYERIDVDSLHRSLMTVEQELSSEIGYHAALPHAYCNEIEDSLVLVAKLAYPFCQRKNHEELRYVFLVLSPEHRPEIHLNALADISRFLLNEGNRKALEQVETKQQLMAALQGHFTDRGSG
jgi:mannitol/fructose-specific phosphotransferase system IIA component (Ntr-type)